MNGPPRPPGPGAATLLERHLPRFDFAERHRTRVAAPLAATWAAAHRLDLGESWPVRLLFRLRGLPAGALRLEGLPDLGFIPLGERPPSEIALGVIGKFWTPTGHLQRLDAAGFDGFNEPGFAKAVWSFHLAETRPGATLVTTETRILCLDAGARRRFRLYWRLVRPFSGWTRREALRLIRRRAEARE